VMRGRRDVKEDVAVWRRTSVCDARASRCEGGRRCDSCDCLMWAFVLLEGLGVEHQ
jgi:hypothetical protein